MFDDNVSTDVYNNLIDVVNAHLPAMHRYVALRRKLLGLDDLAMYDIYVPVLDTPDEDIPYETAQAIIDEALKPLGDEYRQIVRGAFASRWADVYENEGKTSGAFSSGCYDSIPYILLNYNNKLDDVFTVIHEMGHSMQTWYSTHNQEPVNADYPIFTAEVASTVNESLLYRHLIANAKDDLQKAYLINQYLDGFKGTIFRQTQFAEFERDVHAAVEAGDMPTCESLCKLYGDLNAKYYGPDELRRPHRHRMGPHSAFLQRVLRVQIRNRLFRRDGDLQEDPGGRAAGSGELYQVPQVRRMRLSRRTAETGGRGHEHAGAYRGCNGNV